MKKFWVALSFLFVVPAFVATVQAETNQEKLTDADVIQVALNDAPTKKWQELTEQQQGVLSPLASEWDTLRPWQREKMLDIAKDYPKMDAKNRSV